MHNSCMNEWQAVRLLDYPVPKRDGIYAGIYHSTVCHSYHEQPTNIRLTPPPHIIPLTPSPA